jgi:hypothetical protein
MKRFNHSTQRDKILALLVAARGGEVGLPQIKACAAQYAARICELRRAGFRIPPPRMETVNGRRHSWYRLEPEPARTTISKAPMQESEPEAESLFGSLSREPEYPD